MSTITWYGHSAFRLSDDNVSILIDPYFSVPSLEPEVIEDGVDLVLITHDHGDHTGDCVDICKKTHAKLGAIVGTAGALQKKGHPGQPDYRRNRLQYGRHHRLQRREHHHDPGLSHQ